MTPVLSTSEQKAEDNVKQLRVTPRTIEMTDRNNFDNQSLGQRVLRKTHSRIEGYDPTIDEDSVYDPSHPKIKYSHNRRPENSSGEITSAADLSTTSYPIRKHGERKRSTTSNDSTVRRSLHHPSSSTLRYSQIQRHERHRNRYIGAGSLKFISIFDTVTSLTLFQHEWPNKWTEAREQAVLGKLVQAFYQFANTVGEEEVKFVNFEEFPMAPSTRNGAHNQQDNSTNLSSNMSTTGSAFKSHEGTHLTNHLHRRGHSTATLTDNYSVRSSFTAVNNKSSLKAMQGLFTHDEIITVAVFFDIPSGTTYDVSTQELVRTFMERCRTEFNQMFSKQVMGMSERLKTLATSSTQAELEELQNDYSDFRNYLDSIKDECFHQSNK